MSAFPKGDMLPWCESKDLPRIEHCREPTSGGDMQRRGSSGKPVKRRRRSTNRANTRKALAATPSVVELQEQLDQRTRERDEALEQQAATADVLRIVSSSPGELEPVFNAMLENATRLCEARYGAMWLREGDAFRAASLHGPLPPAFIDLLRSGTLFRPSPDTPTGRVVQTHQPVQVLDLRETRAYLDREPTNVAAVEVAGIRTMFSVPMLKEDQLVGTISIYRQEVCPFTEKQIELVKNFAAQAVIAIENTRLLNELRESLQHQTASSEILASISGAITDTKPVFDAIVRNLLRLFGTCFATIQLLRGGTIEMSAFGGELGVEKIVSLYPRPLDETTAGGQAMVSRQVVQFSPVVGNPLVPPAAQQIASELNYESIIAAPMIRQDKVIGAIICAHREQRVFNEKEVALIRAFADQAVIAIENGRLFDEVQGRTRELSESLEQQTATSEVLGVISSSPGELEPVFNAILENATRICDAKFGVLWRRFDDGTARIFSSLGVPSAFAEYLQRGPHRPGPFSPFNGVAKPRLRLHIADFRADQAYLEHDPLAVAGVELGGQRTVVVVPMLKEDRLVGMIAVYRQEVRPFTDKQIELV